MSRVEIEFAPKIAHIREEFVWSHDPDLPPVFVRENVEGSKFEVVSSFNLAGVAIDRNRQATKRKDSLKVITMGEQYLRTLLAGLNGERRIDFVYTGGKDAQGREYLRWKLMSRAWASSLEESIQGAQQIWRNLGVAFHSIENAYEFSPVITLDELCESNEEGLWTTTMRPLGVEISRDSRKPLGFTRHIGRSDGNSKSVMVPYHPFVRTKHLNSVIGLLGCRSRVRVVLSLTPIRLSADELRTVASALEWLRNGEPKAIKYQQGLSVEESEAINGLQRYLGYWLKNPTGYKVNCVVSAREPVPPALIAMIGREVFHSLPITTESKWAGAEETPATNELLGQAEPETLDLRDLINSAAPLPPVFPSAAGLLSAGVKRFHCPPHLELPDEGHLLGRVSLGNSERNVRFDQSTYHSYIIGSTGVGKSTLMRSMISQSIDNDKGIALIDPHGDLYQQILEDVPRRRVKDVVLIDYCDFEHAVGINFLECTGPYKQMQMSFVANEMIKIFDRLYDLRLTGGPMFEQYMRNALLLIMDNDFPGATLVDIPLLFEDKEYRDFLLGKCRNPLIVNFWKKQAERAMGEISLNNMAPYITSKLNQFTTNSLVRPIIGQSQSTINFRRVMDKGQILLVNLSKGLLSEMDVQLLGMLIIGRIFCSAMERASVPVHERRPFRMFIDEFQNFTTDTVTSLLSEARKYRLYLTLAHQNLAQISSGTGRQSILEAVLGNVGSLLLFRLGAIDALKMEAYTKPELEAEDLQELPDYQAAARLQINNRLSRPFVLKTLPVSAKVDAAESRTIIQESKGKYTRPTVKVEEGLLRRRTSYSEWQNDQAENQMTEIDGRGERHSRQEGMTHVKRTRCEHLESLRLSKTRTLDQLNNATKPAHRNMLQRALRALEIQIEESQQTL
jgi:GTPase SAR1 family protein